MKRVFSWMGTLIKKNCSIIYNLERRRYILKKFIGPYFFKNELSCLDWRMFMWTIIGSSKMELHAIQSTEQIIYWKRLLWPHYLASWASRVAPKIVGFKRTALFFVGLCCLHRWIKKGLLAYPFLCNKAKFLAIILNRKCSLCVQNLNKRLNKHCKIRDCRCANLLLFLEVFSQFANFF